MRTMLSIIAALALSAPPTVAQETTTGSIDGRILDPQGLGVPGVTITVSSPQGSQTFVTDNDGRFIAPFLTPGTYTVRAELTGFRPVEQQNVQVRLGQRVTLPLTLPLGTLSEQVEVRADTRILNLTSASAGANIDTDLLSRIPIGRRFSDTLYIAPGVSSGGSVGQANPSISGGSGLENQYVVDGVDIKNPGYGGLGSYSIVFGSLGSGTPFDFIQEVQVKTAGYEAEFGQSTGGVVNVVTKSGSNDLHGSAFGYFRPKQLESDFTQLTTLNGVVNQRGTRLNDVGATVGGPALQNKVFFFGAIDPQWEEATFAAPDTFPLARLGDVPRDRRVTNYAAKGTWQIASGDRLDASFFGDPSHGALGPQRSGTTGTNDPLLRQDESAFSTIDKYGGHNQSVRFSGALGARWLVEAGYARAANDVVETPFADEWQTTDRTVTPNIRTGGIGLYDQSNHGVNNQLMAKATNVFNTGFGEHQLRYGVQYQHVSFDNVVQRTGPTITLPDGQQSVTGAQVSVQPDPTFGQIYRVTRANITNVRQTTQHYASVFVQDAWKIGNRLTVTPGIRYEQQTLAGELSDLTLKNNWAPRIGVVYDPTGTGRARVFANWGLFYAQIPNDLAARALSADASVSRADYFDAALTRPIPNGVLAGGVTSHFQLAGLTADTIDPNVKAGYVNEVLVGAEYQLAPGLNVGARYIRRRIPRVLEDVQPYPLVACDLGIEAACNVEYLLTNPGPDTPTLGGLGASFEAPIHHYDAVEFTADKRFGNRWGLQASYRWSRLWGTYEGFYRDDNGQSDPGITSLFDFPTNDPTYATLGRQFGYRGDIRFLGSAGAGPLPLDRPHQVKVFGNYAFDIGLNLGAGITLSSGRPLTALAANPSYTSPGEIPETPRGDGFETSDGFRTRTPFLYDTNLHADYGLRLGAGQRRVVLIADIFNLLNTQRVTDYNNYTETTFGSLNPDFGQPYSAVLGIPAFQSPRQIRLGARIEF